MTSLDPTTDLGESPAALAADELAALADDRARATYECGACDFRIVDTTDDAEDFELAVEHHESTHHDDTPPAAGVWATRRVVEGGETEAVAAVRALETPFGSVAVTNIRDRPDSIDVAVVREDTWPLDDNAVQIGEPRVAMYVPEYLPPITAGQATALAQVLRRAAEALAASPAWKASNR